MLQLYWKSMPLLTVLVERLQPWGNVALLRKQTLRLIPFDSRFPPIYINQNGSIDVLDSELDLFEQADCVEQIQRWLGVSDLDQLIKVKGLFKNLFNL